MPLFSCRTNWQAKYPRLAWWLTKRRFKCTKEFECQKNISPYFLWFFFIANFCHVFLHNISNSRSPTARTERVSLNKETRRWRQLLAGNVGSELCHFSGLRVIVEWLTSRSSLIFRPPLPMMHPAWLWCTSIRTSISSLPWREPFWNRVYNKSWKFEYSVSAIYVSVMNYRKLVREIQICIRLKDEILSGHRWNLCAYLFQIRYDLVQHLQNSGQVRADGKHPRIRRTPGIILISTVTSFRVIRAIDHIQSRANGVSCVRRRDRVCYINQRCQSPTHPSTLPVLSDFSITR